MSEEMLHSFTDILTEFRALQARVKLVEENNTALEAKVDALSEDLSKVQQLNEAFRSTVAELRTALETDRAEKNKLRSVDGEEKAPADSRSYNQKMSLMRIGKESLVDSFTFLDRLSLDALKLTCSGFRELIAREMGTVCLRRLNHVVTEAYFAAFGDTRRYKITIFIGMQNYPYGDPEPAKDMYEIVCEDSSSTVELLMRIVQSSFIYQTLDFQDIRLNAQAMRTVTKFAPTIFLNSCLRLIQSSIRSNAEQFHAAILSFGRFEALEMTKTLYLERAHLNDSFIDSLARKGVDSIKLEVYSPEGDSYYDISDEAILQYCFAPPRQTRQRELVVEYPSVSKDFFKKLVKAHETSDAKHAIELELRRVPQSTQDTNGFESRQYESRGHRQQYFTVEKPLNSDIIFSNYQDDLKYRRSECRS